MKEFAHIFKPNHHYHRLKAKLCLVFVLILLQPLPIACKGLVGKLPGNPASCPEEPCNSDPQHVLYALKWMSVIFGFILLIPLLGYYLSKCYTKILSYSKSSPSSSKESSVSSTSSASDRKQKRTNNGATTKKTTEAHKGKRKYDNKQQVSDSAESAADSTDLALLEANQLLSEVRRKSSAPGIQNNNTSFVNQQKDIMSNRKLSSALAAQFNQADNAKLGQLNSEISHLRNIELAQLMAGSNDAIEQQQQQQQRFGADNAQLDHRYSIMVPQQQQQQQQPDVKSYSRSLKGRPSSGRRLMKIYPAELQQLAPSDAEGDSALDANNDYDQQHFRQKYSNQQSLLANRRPSSGHRESPDGHYMDLEQQQQQQQRQQKQRQEKLAQISLVSQLRQQQPTITTNNNNTLALPNNYNQHRHSIDGSILNGMAHHMQHSHDQVNSLTPSELAQVRQFSNSGRLSGLETHLARGRSASKNLNQMEVQSAKSGYHHNNEQFLFADEPNQHRDRRPSLNAAVMRHNL